MLKSIFQPKNTEIEDKKLLSSDVNYDFTFENFTYCHFLKEIFDNFKRKMSILLMVIYFLQTPEPRNHRHRCKPEPSKQRPFDQPTSPFFRVRYLGRKKRLKFLRVLQYQIFLYFKSLVCERNYLDFLLILLQRTTIRDVIVQIIQNMGILIYNIENPQHLCNQKPFFSLLAVFILSHKTLNEFILHGFDFEDEEIVSYYISFLKSLSIRIASNLVELFYNEVNFFQSRFWLKNQGRNTPIFRC